MKFDVAIIGAGVVGLATGYRLLQRRPDVKVVFLEKESRIAQHQSGHNSGIIHSGIYYKPGSLRATLCREGRSALIEFAREHSIPYELCGKLVMATDTSQLAQLQTIHERALANGAPVQLLEKEEIREREPAARGVKGLWVPGTGIIDFHRYADQLSKLSIAMGAELKLDTRVTAGSRVQGGWCLESSSGEIHANYVVNAAGLFCDRVVRSLGGIPPIQIVPFRGEYYALKPHAAHLCRALIYPVPDSRFPFLGVHVSRHIDGSVTCGPNAVVGLSREGYSWKNINAFDIVEMCSYRGFQKFALKHWRTGLSEVLRSVIKARFLKSVQELLPSVTENDLTPSIAGVRAQAILRNGALEDDFCFHQSEGVLHVLNAPSPAATSSLAIGARIAEMVVQSCASAA